MVNSKIVEQYFNQGKNLTPVKDRKPVFNDWTNLIFSKEKILKHTGNVGWVVGVGDLVVDVDPRNGGDVSFKKLLKFLRASDPTIDLEPTVLTPSGGFHIYLKISEEYADKKFRKTLNKTYRGIDFLTKGTQCVIPSSSTEKGVYKWADSLLGMFQQNLAPTALVHLLISGNVNEDEEDLGDFTGLLRGDSADWSEDKVKAMIDRLDPSMSNDEWVKVGMALHDWNPIDGLPVWDEWSKLGDNYTEGDTETRWKSFDVSGGVTLGTISYLVKEVDYNEKAKKLNNYIEQIRFSDEKQLEFDLITKLKKEEFSKIDREKLAKTIQERYLNLLDVRISIADVRQMITPFETFTGTLVEEEEKPSWCNNWIYVNSHAGFINMNSLRLHKSESFNIENGKYIPVNDTGHKPSASKFVSDSGFIDKADAIAYLPQYDGVIYNDSEGSSILNTFNPKSVPSEAEAFTKEGKEAIKLVKKHIKFICSTDADSDVFMQWLAHQVQHQGRQVLWSPVVQSIQGVGKSFFGELLRSCLGDRNVGTVSPSQVVNEFNGWATNVTVNILEELRVKGHNRYDAVNALKPLITDRMIQINDKGVKQYMTYNTTNYMCFTNYKDALPLDEDDRRWWVIFVPIQSLQDLHLYVGEDATTYFPKLFNAVREHGGEIRKWLLDYKITSNFMNTKQAPMTQHKLSMIATENDSFEGLTELKDLIDEGGKFFNNKVVSSGDLFDALLFEHPHFDIQSSKRNMLLKKLGYMLLPHPVKIEGKTRRIWAKSQIPNNKVRDLLLENQNNLENLDNLDGLD